MCGSILLLALPVSLVSYVVCTDQPAFSDSGTVSLSLFCGSLCPPCRFLLSFPGRSASVFSFLWRSWCSGCTYSRWLCHVCIRRWRSRGWRWMSTSFKPGWLSFSSSLAFLFFPSTRSRYLALVSLQSADTQKRLLFFGAPEDIARVDMLGRYTCRYIHLLQTQMSVYVEVSSCYLCLGMRAGFPCVVFSGVCPPYLRAWVRIRMFL